MTTISLSGKTAGLRRFLVHTALFGAVVTVGFVGMLTTDRQLAFSTCVECSQGAGSGGEDMAAIGSGGEDMAAILRE